MLDFIALPFWIIFILKRDFWWALFPAGVLTSIALMTLVPSRFEDLGVAIMFFGWAATFLLVYFLAKQKWAIWPVIGLGILGVSFLAGAFEYLWLSVADRHHRSGAYLIYRAMRKVELVLRSFFKYPQVILRVFIVINRSIIVLIELLHGASMEEP